MTKLHLRPVLAIVFLSLALMPLLAQPANRPGLKVPEASPLQARQRFAPEPFMRFSSDKPTGPERLRRRIREIPSAYSFEQLGFFCKWEVRLEQAARMPVKFRLGEVQYVERLEGKLPQY